MKISVSGHGYREIYDDHCMMMFLFVDLLMMICAKPKFFFLAKKLLLLVHKKSVAVFFFHNLFIFGSNDDDRDDKNFVIFGLSLRINEVVVPKSTNQPMCVNLYVHDNFIL